MIVPDTNLLLYAANRQGLQHARAVAWLESQLSGDESVGIAWLVVVGVVRIATHPKVFEQPLPLASALKFIDTLLAHPNVVEIDPGKDHWSIMRALLHDVGSARNLTNDAHLAALCIERGATLHSADGDFSRFRGLRWENPLAR